MSNQQDVALQQRLSRGDETAFQETFELYFKVLVLFATKFSLDKEAAEDLVQDVFVKLYEQRDRLQFHSSLKAFLYQSCLLYTSPSPRDQRGSRMPSSA